ncbi:MAG: protein kinase [Ignavibacteriaceae bacterium]
MVDKIRDYKIIKKIGEGGMGTVYLAEDVMLEREVAIKVLNPLLTKDSHFTERFRHEAKVQASLIHSNIVTLYNYFFEEDNYCMVMEFVDGVTLKQLITNTGPLPEQKTVWVLNQILEAVGFAHKKGIIHRDIKPSNILLTGDNTVKILDFGIAKILQDKGLTKTGTKMGTIYYMSPEQIKAVKDIDNRTDIYSIGVTLYEMLSGRIPFNVDTDSDFEIMNEIVTGEIRDPRQFYPHISEWLVDVLFASVEKDRAKRIQNVDDFTKRLLSKEGKAAVMGTADKTIIEEPKVEVKEPQKVVTPPPTPVQTKPKPVDTIKPVNQVKSKSSNKKIFLFGGIGLIAAVIIYFAVTSIPDPDPYDPFFEEDSILIFDEPYTNKNYNIESVLKSATPQPEGRTERKHGPGIPSKAQLTYPAYYK